MSEMHAYDIEYVAEYDDESVLIFGDGREAVYEHGTGHVDLSDLRAPNRPQIAAERIEALADELGDLR